MSLEETFNMTIQYTPIGTIKFMALSRPIERTKKDGTTTADYTIKLQIDGNTPEGDSLRKTLKSLNPKKIVATTPEGDPVGPTSKHFNVTFSSQYAPQLVLDPNNNELEGNEIPLFHSKTDTGTAAVGYEVKESQGQAYINLKSVKLVSLDLAPKADYNELMQEMKEKLRAIQNG